MQDSELDHPIVLESFTIIDRELTALGDLAELSVAEYAIVRRVIHSTADFEFRHLVQVSEGAIEGAIAALQNGVPLITDVGMVRQGIAGRVAKTFGNPIWVAVEQAASADPGKTRTETGLERCWQQVPHGIYVIGNAPTALLALCRQCAIAQDQGKSLPALVIGAPVGFVSVLESKTALAATPVPQILVTGRKGGSAVAAAIVNALLGLAWDASQATSSNG